MGTPRRHRLTRGQSEQLLDGLGGPDDLTMLLADARPSRADGELPGETVAVAAFRSAAVRDLAPHPRSSSVRTLSLSRTLALKVLAVATAGVAVSGVAVAATGHFPGTHHAAPAASSTKHLATASKVVEGKDGDHGDPTHPTGPPTGTPGHRADDVHGIGLCRAWAEITHNDASALTKSARFHELTTTAGGAGKVIAYCTALTNVWCENHHWPVATTTQLEGRPVVMRCLRPTDKSVVPTHPITPGGTVPHPVSPGGGKPMPSGGPVRN